MARRQPPLVDYVRIERALRAHDLRGLNRYEKQEAVRLLLLWNPDMTHGTLCQWGVNHQSARTFWEQARQQVAA